VLFTFFAYIFGFAFQSGDEDRRIMERMQSGDKSAVSDLYQRYNKVLFGLILTVVKNREEAEDVLQDVFVQAWEKASQFDSTRGNVYSFLVTMARNKAIDRIRSRRYRKEKQEDQIINDFTLDPEDGDFNPEENAELNDRAVRVRRALKNLDEKEREVLYVAYFQGLSQSEIAEQMDIPLGTVKYRMRQGMIKLRDSLSLLAE